MLELSMAAVAIQKEIPTKSFCPRSRNPSLAPLSSNAAELGMKVKINNKYITNAQHTFLDINLQNTPT